MFYNAIWKRYQLGSVNISSVYKGEDVLAIEHRDWAGGAKSPEMENAHFDLGNW